LDGWRAVLEDGQIHTRHGRLLNAPDWFLAGLPAAVLDGELYAGRVGVGAVVSAIQRDEWSGLSFHAFDAPLHFGDFAHRLEYVERVCAGTTANFVPHEVVMDYAHAREIARRYFQSGGEGAVFRDPRGLYHAGSRSQQVLKCKPGV